MSVPVSIKRELWSCARWTPPFADPSHAKTDAGTKYDLALDPAQPPLAFKQLIYDKTGVGAC